MEKALTSHTAPNTPGATRTHLGREFFTRGMVKVPLAALVATAMIVGIWSALVRLGWVLPAPLTNMAGLHGPLMISGMLGTLIGLERAVAMSNLTTGLVNPAAGRTWHWAYLAPLGSGLGAVALMAGAAQTAQILTIFAAIVLGATYVRLLKLHIAAYTFVMGLGAVMWLVGNVLWLAGQPFALLVHWWIAFLVLTVVGERLELARMTSMSATRRNLFLVGVAVYLLGLPLLFLQPDWGVRVAGVGQIGLALWMARYDIARRTVRKPGLARYIAFCLLSGYVWLGAAGSIALYAGMVYGGFLYDALLHAVLMGFIFSMIFGHAPIILPALTGLQVHFYNLFYVPLVALHLTLLLRIFANLTGWLDGRMWGGLLNAFTLVVFVLVVIGGVVLGRRRGDGTAQSSALPRGG